MVKLIPTLVKVLHSGNKILADVGHQAIKGVLNTVENLSGLKSILEVLLHELEKSKSGHVHHRLSTYLYQVLCDKTHLLKRGQSVNDVVSAYMKESLTSTNPDCRQVARRALLIW